MGGVCVLDTLPSGSCQCNDANGKVETETETETEKIETETEIAMGGVWKEEKSRPNANA